MFRECIGGPLDGDRVPDFGPGEIHIRLEAMLPVMLIRDDPPGGGVPFCCERYWGCPNGHYHHDPE